MPPASDKPIHVAKFGGTSVGSPERVREVVRLVAAMPRSVRPVVVSSAFGGVTDRLLAAISAAKARSGEHTVILAELRARHLTALAREDEHAALGHQLDAIFGGVAELLQGVYLLRECTPRFQDAIISAGERLAVPLVAAAFRSAGLDAVVKMNERERFTNRSTNARGPATKPPSDPRALERVPTRIVTGPGVGSGFTSKAGASVHV